MITVYFVCYRADEASDAASHMIGSKLITKQAPMGRICNQVMLSERLYSRREFYFAIAMERSFMVRLWDQCEYHPLSFIFFKTSWQDQIEIMNKNGKGMPALFLFLVKCTCIWNELMFVELTHLDICHLWEMLFKNSIMVLIIPRQLKFFKPHQCYSKRKLFYCWDYL